VLHQLHRFVAVNGALEVDLAGNVNAELVGGRQVGAVGGQLDFCRAASASPGGRSIIALPSSTSKGGSRVVPQSEIVTTPGDYVGYVVTEFGAAELVGKSTAERAQALIAVAHPDAREDLERAAHLLSQ